MMNSQIQNKVLTKQQLDMMEDFQHQFARVAASVADTPAKPDSALFSMDLSALFVRASIGQLQNIEKVSQSYAKSLGDYAALTQYALLKGQGIEVEPVVKPDSDDNRFKDAEWSGSLWFDVMKQSYLIQSEFLNEFFDQPRNLSDKESKKLEFFKNQWIDSAAPTNYPLTNPAVLKELHATKGKSLVDGLKNFADDLQQRRGVRMVEGDAFELGRNIAVTEGKVIARNRLAELIQYSSATEQVSSVPIMIIPPWINKYYILDLSPKNSFIGWLVDQGYTVFVVSWMNPDESYRETEYDDYLSLGPIWAADIIQSVTGSEKINAIGYCLGGTLLATYLGYLAQQDKASQCIQSATFFTTMIDFSEPGDLGVFVDEESVSKLEETMQETGYLEGKSMASTFSMMRSNDLIWHFVINNYMLGKSPGKFDLLYWNSDSTRMPAKMHSSYLRNMYLENRLTEPNGLTVLGVPIDLTKVDIPTCFIATELDHIAPWRSVYAGTRQFSGNKKFLLGESGHIAGIINPPAKNKYGYWTNRYRLAKSPDQWLSRATYRSGSWWPEWSQWTAKFSGEKVVARQCGNEAFQPLADAPGTYVKL